VRIFCFTALAAEQVLEQPVRRGEIEQDVVVRTSFEGAAMRARASAAEFLTFAHRLGWPLQNFVLARKQLKPKIRTDANFRAVLRRKPERASAQILTKSGAVPETAPHSTQARARIGAHSCE
jgi:hypothetical protein